MATPKHLPAPLERLREAPQSVWLDFISRQILEGGLQRMIDDGWLQGLTSNPSIFAKAIEGSEDYDDQLAELAEAGITEPYEAFVRLAAEDIRAAADLFLPIYEVDRNDGFVSLELPPGMEHDTAASVTEAIRLRDLVGRPNVMIKVPGTDEGVAASRRLIAEGVNVNITLLFSVQMYERYAEAYLLGLEERRAAGRPLDDVSSVASFFVSRLDTLVDPLLPEDSTLRGRAAIANALTAYASFQSIFRGDRWNDLVNAGARVQRPLWGSTSTKNPAFPDTMYVDRLVLPHTVNTIPMATLHAFVDHGDGRVIDDATVDAAPDVLAELESAGIDLDQATAQLLVEGLDSFKKDYDNMLRRIAEALSAARAA